MKTAKTLSKWDVFLLVVMILALVGLFVSIFLWTQTMYLLMKYQNETTQAMEEITNHQKEITSIMLEVIKVFQ